MLWVGWYGFNSGSAVAADVIAANAFTTTTIATAVASFVWPMCEWIVKGKPSVLGFCSGAVAGLVAITPACGYVTPQGAIWIGIAVAIVCWFMCYKVKAWFGYDDALDTFGVHAIGGTLGAIMTGMLARNIANPNFATNLKANMSLTHCFQPLVMGTGQGGLCDTGAGHPRHHHPRLHHQDAGWPASDRRSRNGWSRRDPNTAKLAITADSSVSLNFTRRAMQVARRFFFYGHGHGISAQKSDYLFSQTKCGYASFRHRSYDDQPPGSPVPSYCRGRNSY